MSWKLTGIDKNFERVLPFDVRAYKLTTLPFVTEDKNYFAFLAMAIAKIKQNEY